MPVAWDCAHRFPPTTTSKAVSNVLLRLPALRSRPLRRSIPSVTGHEGLNISRRWHNWRLMVEYPVFQAGTFETGEALEPGREEFLGQCIRGLMHSVRDVRRSTGIEVEDQALAPIDEVAVRAALDAKAPEFVTGTVEYQ